MTFKLGATSLLRLEGLHPDLVRVVTRAISLSSIDFTVLEGIRTPERQAELVAAGASSTMHSRHITGHAVDLGALVGGKVRWDWALYFKIADAMQSAAIDEDVDIVWGGVWDKEIREYVECHDEHLAYIARKVAEFKKKKSNRQPFLDGPHFQLSHRTYPE